MDLLYSQAGKPLKDRETTVRAMKALTFGSIASDTAQSEVLLVLPCPMSMGKINHLFFQTYRNLAIPQQVMVQALSLELTRRVVVLSLVP